MNDEPNNPNHIDNLYKYVTDNFRKVFEEDTATLSRTCRRLALGVGVAIISMHGMSLILNKIIMILIVLFFIFDALHYFITSHHYLKLTERYEKKSKMVK